MSSFDFGSEGSHIPNREELLQMAIHAAKANNREGAKVMFRQVLDEDPRNERAMMWLAKLSESKMERRRWLERVLTVNPDSQLAKDTLRRIAYRTSARENRVLVVFGVVAGVLIILAIVIVLALALMSGANPG